MTTMTNTTTAKKTRRSACRCVLDSTSKSVIFQRAHPTITILAMTIAICKYEYDSSDAAIHLEREIPKREDDEHDAFCMLLRAGTTL